MWTWIQCHKTGWRFRIHWQWLKRIKYRVRESICDVVEANLSVIFKQAHQENFFYLLDAGKYIRETLLSFHHASSFVLLVRTFCFVSWTLYVLPWDNWQNFILFDSFPYGTGNDLWYSPHWRWFVYECNKLFRLYKKLSGLFGEIRNFNIWICAGFGDFIHDWISCYNIHH